MRIGSRLSVVAAGLFLGALPALAADVAGKWTAEFDTQVGPQKYTYELKVDGEKVTGKAFFERMGQKGEAEILEGKLAGDVLTFVEVLDFQGSSVRIEYKGTVKADQIDFVRKVGDFATEQFLAHRAKD
jgi:hypothetical protein